MPSGYMTESDRLSKTLSIQLTNSLPSVCQSRPPIIEVIVFTRGFKRKPRSIGQGTVIDIISLLKQGNKGIVRSFGIYFCTFLLSHH